MRMIIDVHTHNIQPEDFSDFSLRAMERAGLALKPFSFETYAAHMRTVDRSILFGVRAVASGWACPNDRTAEWVRRDPDRIIGFAAIDPMEDNHIEELERGVEDLGLRGVKLYPVLGRYSPADPLVFPLYAEAQRRDLPVLFHVGTASPAQRLAEAQPAAADRRGRPGVPGPQDRDRAHGAPLAARVRRGPTQASPTYTRTSPAEAGCAPTRAWQALVLMCEWGVTDKLLFGSDFPLWTPLEGMEGMRRLNRQVEGTNLPRVPEEVVEGIIHRDSLPLLGLA